MPVKIQWISMMAWMLVLAATQVKSYQIMYLCFSVAVNYLVRECRSVCSQCSLTLPHLCFVLVYYREVSPKCLWDERINGSVWRNCHRGAAEQRVVFYRCEFPRPLCLAAFHLSYSEIKLYINLCLLFVQRCNVCIIYCVLHAFFTEKIITTHLHNNVKTSQTLKIRDRTIKI